MGIYKCLFLYFDNSWEVTFFYEKDHPRLLMSSPFCAPDLWFALIQLKVVKMKMISAGCSRKEAKMLSALKEIDPAFLRSGNTNVVTCSEPACNGGRAKNWEGG